MGIFTSKDRAKIRNEEEEKAWKKYNDQLTSRDTIHKNEITLLEKKYEIDKNDIHSYYASILSDKETTHQKAIQTILNEKEISLNKISNEYSASLALEHKRVDSKIKELDNRIDRVNSLIDENESLKYQLINEIKTVKSAKNSIIKFRERLGIEVATLMSIDGIAHAEMVLNKITDTPNVKILKNNPSNRELTN